MSHTHEPLQLLTMSILDNAYNYSWSIQGFGVLRLYIRGIGRLHIWDSTQRFANASMIHTHSWDLSSTVVTGKLVNHLYHEDYIGLPYNKVHLLTGYDSKLLSEPKPIFLTEWARQIYRPGDTYSQPGSHIHYTEAQDGTVTVMARREDKDGEADVYWPQGEEWGTARPRTATTEEVARAIEKVRWDIL